MGGWEVGLGYVTELRWPVVAGCGIFVFRNKIGDLIGRIQDLKATVAGMTFEMKVRAAKDWVDEIRAPETILATDNFNVQDTAKRIIREPGNAVRAFEALTAERQQCIRMAVDDIRTAADAAPHQALLLKPADGFRQAAALLDSWVRPFVVPPSVFQQFATGAGEHIPDLWPATPDPIVFGYRNIRDLESLAASEPESLTTNAAMVFESTIYEWASKYVAFLADIIDQYDDWIAGGSD
ncbi:hypothetical protein [Nocardia brasiliensis]|uniref:hypothetical protein n=1 Tax=Nocardia brasiliensis TaxID=37326 RepID=UPI001EEC84E1|nr:hypothetical protein [Nocardia brasiliensis]